MCGRMQFTASLIITFQLVITSLLVVFLQIAYTHGFTQVKLAHSGIYPRIYLV